MTTTTEIDNRLGSNLRRRRRLLGMTQHELAIAIEVGFRQIHKYETGLNRISAARLWTLAGALKVPVTYFFEGLNGDGRAYGEGRTAAPYKEDLPKAYRGSVSAV